MDLKIERRKEMATPTKKAKEIDELLQILSPIHADRETSIRKARCSWCGKAANEFRDAVSQREYEISGFCQVCQDETFGKGE
jgi:hypothetical protein